MKSCDLLLVASGTATLEAAVLGTPMVVVYRVSPLTWWLFISLLHVKNYALCNIVAEETVVPELIQWRAMPWLIARRSIEMLESGVLDRMRQRLAEVRRKLGTPGASARAADHVVSYLKNA